MDPALLLKGLVMGFSIAAPVGPIGVLCIRRTLGSGILHGVVSGLGTASADAIYGCFAAFGVTAVSDFLLGAQFWLRLVGGVFLLYLGFMTFRSVPAREAAKAGEGRSGGLAGAYASAFFLTLTNPMTIVSFAAVFAGLGLGAAPEGRASAALLVFGVFAGSMLWWLFLSGSVHLLRSRFDHTRLVWVNRLSGLVIAAFGVASIATLAPF
jgi:threonine/homoserine/homoserine lactone efflux protein